MLCMYFPNEYQAILKEQGSDLPDSLEDALKSIEIAERQPPDGESYLKGHAYFLIRGNHVFLVQHMAVRANSLEDYIHDFLRGTQILRDDQRFELQPKLVLSTGAKEMGEIMSVEVGGVPAGSRHQTVRDVAVIDVESHEDLGRVRTGLSKGLAIMDLLFGSTRADDIMASVPEEAELEVDVRFGFRSRKRKLSREALSSIASAARDLPDGQVKAIGRDGRATGSDLRLQTEMPVHRVRANGSLLDLDDARSQLLRVYVRFVEDGKIIQ
jgi:hypothetical protein